MTPHRCDPETGREIKEREEDTDVLARLAHFADRYKLLWWLAIAFSGWVGNRARELEMVPVLAAQQTEIIRRLDKADLDRHDVVTVLRILSRITCSSLSAEDRAKYDITCTDIPVPPAKAK